MFRTGTIALPCCHLRKRRLDLGLFQSQVAQQLGVDEATIHNWEVKATEPSLRHLPEVIRFLGYNPLPSAHTLAEQIVRYRKTLGLSREQLAKRLGVDPGTLWRWETNIRKPAGKYLEIVERLIRDSQSQSASAAIRLDSIVGLSIE